MEKWQIHKLIETDEQGEEFQIGGAIHRLRINAINGSLHEVSVAPVSVEEIEAGLVDGQFVRVQIADRLVMLEPDEVEELLRLFQLAYNAALQNYQKASL